MTKKRFVRTLWEAVVEALTHKPEIRACCYTCKNQIHQGSKIYYAAKPEEQHWCACCGTKIRFENGSHQCVFFQGLKPGEID